MHTDYGYFEETQLGKSYDTRLLKRLYPFIRSYRLLVGWSIALVLGITALDLALPYITKLAIDRYIVPQTTVAGGNHGRADETTNRYLKVDLKSPRNREIVEKYRDLFKVKGQTAVIAIQALGHLKKTDLRILRKNDIAGVSMMATIFLMVVFLDFILNFAQKSL